MTLTLRLVDVAFLDNGTPTEFVLARRGAIIGRSPTCDWSLPDARNHISSRHCEIRYDNGDYLLIDNSTNGTFVNGATDRLAGPHPIADGDRIEIGPFQVAAHVHGAASAGDAAMPVASIGGGAGGGSSPADGGQGWGGWEAHGGAAPPPPPPPAPHGWGNLNGDDGWGQRAAAPVPATPPSPPPVDDGWGPTPGAARGNDGWAARTASPAPAAPVESPWAQPEAQRPAPSAWSSAAPDRAPAPSPDDIWGRIADGHVVDWARGGFGHDDLGGHAGLGLGGGRESTPAAAPPISDVASWAAPPLPPSTATRNDGWGPAPVGETPTSPPVDTADWAAPSGSVPADKWVTPAPSADRKASSPPPSLPPANPVARTGDEMAAFLRGAHLPPNAAETNPAETMERAGDLLRRLVAGLVVMVEARARAKSQMGAEATSFGFDGNNPLKFARSPEQALEQLLSPPTSGFMDAPAAIGDAYQDLQSHQMATLKAMQGALRATLDRFSPAAIRSRAEAGGILTRILPGAREAALWQAYEREFGGVKQDSDEAFMDVFAREFRRAYEEQARAGLRRGG